MTDVEKQESQKTVVAFITGLLIGGLLVWVFSSTPEQAPKQEEQKTDTEEVTVKEGEAKKEEVSAEKKVEAVAETVTVEGKGSIIVTDQAAGKSVRLGALTFPTKSGWVVVRDFKDGMTGNVLGAAQYDADKGLNPVVVELMRETVSGNTYKVVFFTNEGAAAFTLHEDKEIEGAGATFKAN